MRFVPGLGLRSGVMTFEEDDSEEDEEMHGVGRKREDSVEVEDGGGDRGMEEAEGGSRRRSKMRVGRRIRPRSHSLTELPSTLAQSEFSWLGMNGGGGDGDDVGTDQDPATDAFLQTPSSVFKADPLLLPHFSLDTMYSLPPGTAQAPSPEPPASSSRPHRPGRTESGTKTDRSYSREHVLSNKHQQGQTSDEDVRLDLGLGKDLDYTIEEAVKRAKAESSALNKKNSVTAAAVEEDGGMGSNSKRMKEEMLKTKEVPLPVEAARVLNEARLMQQRELLLKSVRALPKNGRKASMGMGLFKESAQVDRADSVPVGREGREKERVERERAERGETSAGHSVPITPATPVKEREAGWLSRSTTRSKIASAAVSEDEQDENRLLLDADVDKLDLAGLEINSKRPRRAHHRAITVPGEPVEVLHEKLAKNFKERRSSNAGIHIRSPFRSRASSPTKERTGSGSVAVTGLPSNRESRSRMASPVISRVQSRAHPSHTHSHGPKHTPASESEWPPVGDYPMGWTSEETWESSSGLSSSESETDPEDEDDEYENGVESDFDSVRRPGRHHRDGMGGRPRSPSPPYISRRDPSHIRQKHLANAQMDHSILPEHDRTGMDSPNHRPKLRLNGNARPGAAQHDESGTSPVDRMTVPLQPFKNKVGGHSEIYKFTRRAVCKVSSGMITGI